jgi:hypothetical protein
MTGRRILLLLALLSMGALAAIAASQLLANDDKPEATARDVASLSDSKRRSTIWALGDAATGSPEARAVARMVKRAGPDRLLYLGDVYEHGTAEEFERNYEPIYGELKDITAPTPGNHEWPKHEEGYDPYWRAAGRSQDDWYSFTSAGWEILGLNSQVEHGPGSPQVRWLKRAVREPGTCRIAFWHRPYLSASRHGDQEDVAPLWNALRGRAVMVLSGNDHNMQRFKPRDGLIQIVSGAGGRHLYGSNENDPRLVWDEDDVFGALRLDLRRGHARLRFVDEDGKTVHSGRVRCRPLRD